MSSGLDLQAGRAGVAALQPFVRRIFAQDGLGQLAGEKMFADARRPYEKISMRQPTAFHGSFKSAYKGVMPADSPPRHGRPPYKWLHELRRSINERQSIEYVQDREELRCENPRAPAHDILIPDFPRGPAPASAGSMLA